MMDRFNKRFLSHLLLGMLLAIFSAYAKPTAVPSNSQEAPHQSAIYRD